MPPSANVIRSSTLSSICPGSAWPIVQLVLDGSGLYPIPVSAMNLTIELTFDNLNKNPSSVGSPVQFLSHCCLFSAKIGQVVTRWFDVSISLSHLQTVGFSSLGLGSHRVRPHWRPARALEVFHFMLTRSSGYLNDGA